MKKTKILFSFFLAIILLSACSTITEGMSEGKRKGSDEFLVEKKAPLVLPPNFGELPEPGTEAKDNEESAKKNQLSIEEILGKKSSTDINKENNNLDKSIEKSIIDKINEQ